MKSRVVLCVATVAFLGLGFHARVVAAPQIGVSFYNPSNGMTGPLTNLPSTNLTLGLVAPRDVRQSFWNDLAGGPNNGSGSQTGLIDSSGASTTATITWTGTDIDALSDWISGTDDRLMLMGAIINVFEGPLVVSMSDVPVEYLGPNGFDLVVYADPEFVGNVQTVSVLSGSTLVAGPLVMTDNQTSLGITPFDPLVHYDDASVDSIGNYVVFAGLATSAFEIHVSSENLKLINGIQLVANPIPEPTAVGVSLLMGMLLTRRVRL